MGIPFKLSPSAAHRWVQCPGAAFLAALPAPWSPSVYAARGTVAQRVNEICLRDGRLPAEFLGQTFEQDGYKITLKADDIAAIDECVSNIRYAVDLDGAELLIEEPFQFVVMGVEIRGRWDFGLCTDTYIEVSDYKHGVGKYVSAFENWQIFLYMIAARQKFGDTSVSGRALRGSIIMPRHRLGSSTWAIDGDTYHDMYVELAETVESIKQLSEGTPGQLVNTGYAWCPGDHCKWCPGELSCPAKAQLLTAAALGDKTRLDENQVLWCLDHEKVIGETLSAARTEAKARLERNEQVRGYKLVQTKPKATGLKPDDVLDETARAKLRDLGISSDVPVRTDIGVTEARKIAKRAGLDIEPLLKHSTPSIKLVDEDDKRPAYVPAERLFDAQG